MENNIHLFNVESKETKAMKSYNHIPALLVALAVSLTPISVVNRAYAASDPRLNLSISGPKTAKVNKALSGLNIKLVNPGEEAQDSRLRLFIHDGADRDFNFGDIKIDVQEQGGWQPLQVEFIDGGVMGTIGQEGKEHKQNHARGGFKIAKNFNNVWQIRVTFAQPGQYQLVVAVSPDNGSSHLAQPAAYNLEVI